MRLPCVGYECSSGRVWPYCLAESGVCLAEVNYTMFTGTRSVGDVDDFCISSHDEGRQRNDVPLSISSEAQVR